ncbi:uncharacterized protein ATNIH1004_007262 [Aspergillus tanneri]|uniref:Major facilitator superfamily (MFS) profile domain-containing protein n=1 Tax=Aspergillus tanneri TaxID=1220188 RepID=A0A5M9MFX1_9EURO|nr:uncharacterized protein ATNIH1004_007262 [Aspergillus tanneri]KAA8645841.1 hypothetical protein ATNIH1004_007262 [Aspergillus tanneri]
MGTSSNDAAQEQEKWETLMTPPGAPDDHKYPSGLRLVLLMISLYVAMFLVALDKLIISTATPSITNKFHLLDKLSWYGMAYMLTNCAFLLIFGEIYSFVSVKAVFLTAAVLFEVGSAVCCRGPGRHRTSSPFSV